jgi:hypothetical protein
MSSKNDHHHGREVLGVQYHSGSGCSVYNFNLLGITSNDRRFKLAPAAGQLKRSGAGNRGRRATMFTYVRVTLLADQKCVSEDESVADHGRFGQGMCDESWSLGP